MIRLSFFISLLFLLGCTHIMPQKVELESPNGSLKLTVELNEDYSPIYHLTFHSKVVIDTSKLGYTFTNAKPMLSNFKIVEIELFKHDETWDMPWGEQKEVRNHYAEMLLSFRENSGDRIMNVRFKLYNDGLGFRYEFPEQQAMNEVLIEDEHTEFNLIGNPTTWWIPGDWDIYEHLYRTTSFQDIDAIQYRGHESLAQTYIPNNAVNTPVTLRREDGIHLSFHEANLTDYSGMTLLVDKASNGFNSVLVGSERTPYKVKKVTPFVSPWRTIQVSEKATELISSKLILNLNEPNQLGDVSWFTPMKYMGIWWDMHLGRKSWDMASGKHGATTDYAKEFIDFASENNIKGLLVEGWNTGWEHWIGFEDREGVFDFVTPYPDYDLKEVVRYGREKGVELIMHHETSAAPRTYEQQLDTAFALMQSLGIHSVKTGYVGKIIPKGEYHHGQWMVNHYRKVLTTAAKYQVAINAHEPIKATGIRRTFPNAISREGLRGQEFNAWSGDGGNPPEHLPIVAFTRMLSGPIDFTPGIFNISLAPYKDQNQINTTLAHQLALYVVIYSPIQMAADLIDHYKNQPAFQFIRDVGVDWDETVVLNGEVGDFVTIARKEKGTGNWFIGGITDENERTITLDLSFIPDLSEYKAVLYRDGKSAHYKTNPTDIVIESKEFNSSSTIDIQLAQGGGFALSLMKN